MDYKKTEWILYKHFEKIHRLNRLKKMEINQKERISRIKDDIKNTNIELKDNLKAIDYQLDRVQSSAYNHLEAQIEQAINNLLDKLTWAIRDLRKIKNKIYYLEKKVESLQIILDEFREEEKLIIIYRYSDKRSLREIERLLARNGFYSSKTGVHRVKDEIINDLSGKLGQNRDKAGTK